MLIEKEPSRVWGELENTPHTQWYCPPFYWVVGGVSYLLPALFPLVSYLCLNKMVTVMTLEDQEISLVESD